MSQETEPLPVGTKLYDWHNIEHEVRVFVDGLYVLRFQSPKNKKRWCHELHDPYLINHDMQEGGTAHDIKYTLHPRSNPIPWR